MNKPKPRHCKICGEKFFPRFGLQRVCEKYQCKVEYALQVAKKAENKRKKIQAQEDKKRIEELQPRKYWIGVLKRVMHKWVRVRDEGKTCISCDTVLLSLGRPGGDYDAGHYRSVGSAKHLEFDERNIHGQCKHCNDWLKGNQIYYRKGLIERFGVEFVEELEADQEPRKWDIETLRQKIDYYLKATKDILAERAANGR